VAIFIKPSAVVQGNLRSNLQGNLRSNPLGKTETMGDEDQVEAARHERNRTYCFWRDFSAPAS
jgi:hypothetical protein